MDEQLKAIIDDALVEAFGDWCTSDEFDDMQQYFWWIINNGHLPTVIAKADELATGVLHNLPATSPERENAVISLADEYRNTRKRVHLPIATDVTPRNCVCLEPKLDSTSATCKTCGLSALRR